MHLSEVHISNFRNLGNGQPLRVPFREGLNLIVGENDSGKTALIDAIRYCLGTRGQYYERITAKDFFCGNGGQQTEFSIRCVFSKLSGQETADLAEWLTIIPPDSGGTPGRTEIHVNLTAKLQKDESVYPERRTGPKADGPSVDGKLREYLPTTYLRPLRDASAELRPGRRSRLAQILQTLPEMKPEKNADKAGTLANLMQESQKQIADNETIKIVEKRLRDEYLAEAAISGTAMLPRLGMGINMTFEQVVERLELELQPPAGIARTVGRGLGLDNVLFMCAELLLLQSEATPQLPLLLVEEPEAHLHPQMQASVVAMLDNQAQGRRKAQILLTTHSPLLAGSADPASLIMVVGGTTYPMDVAHTKLKAGDYKYLQRFLDATKANLFFAKGVLIVEGDAETILLPAIAEKLGRPLTKYGVSIVNVGSVGLFRYARIFQRQGEPGLPIPVACLSDRDIPPIEAKSVLSATRKTEGEYQAGEIAQIVAGKTTSDDGTVRTFVSPCWTLEFDLADAGLLQEVNRAVTRAKHTGGKTLAVLDQTADDALAALTGSTREKAVAVYKPLLTKAASKAIAAQELADIIKALPDSAAVFRARLPPYLVEAIEYVTPAPTAPPEARPDAGQAG